MPIYRYRCTACGEEAEVWAGMNDPAPEACEACEAEGTMQKAVARTAFHLKGGGWYAQGYAGGSGGGPSSSGSTSSDSSSDSSSSDSGSSDSSSTTSSDSGSSSSDD